MTRAADQLRAVSIERGFATQAPGSVMIAMGRTRVLCAATISTDLPPWLEQAHPPRGWVTGEYAMHPASTPERKARRADGRSTEIRRLIGRALRAAVDLSHMPGVQITCDCDVLYADGGTRTAAITGAYVALADALAHARAKGLLSGQPIRSPVAAVSAGIVDGEPMLDLDYAADSRAEVDLNVVMDAQQQLVEVQGSGEAGVFDRRQLDTMLDLAQNGIRELIAAQDRALEAR